MMLIQILGILEVCIRVVVGFFLVSAVYSAKRIDIKSALSGIVSGIIGGVAVGTGIIYFNANTVIQIAAEVVVITLLASAFLHIEYRKCLFVGIFFEIAIGIGQFLVGACLAIATIDISYIDSGSLKGQIAAGVMCITAVVAAIVAQRSKGSEKKINNRIFIYAFVLVFFGVITVESQSRVEIPQEDAYIWIIMTTCLLCAVQIFNMNKQYEMEKKLAQMNAEQAELLEKEYTELNNAYATNAKLFHDFHNHIGMIRKLVTGGKYEETVEYLDELQAPVRELTDSRWTGDDTIDYLINGKIANANEHEIDMQVQVEYPRHANIKSVDMCAIIGNLIDNALEAAKQVTDEDKRFIRLTIRRINQMLVIKVENSFEAELKKEDGQLKTTKKEGGIHGWGIKSVRAAAEKYDGSVTLTQEDRVFKAVATLSFQGIE